MEYKDTIFLPKTSFEMRANLPAKEPAILEEWDKENIFKKLKFDEKYIVHNYEDVDFSIRLKKIIPNYKFFVSFS